MDSYKQRLSFVTRSVTGRYPRRRVLALSGSTAVATALAAACSSSNNTSNTNSNAAKPSASSAAVSGGASSPVSSAAAPRPSSAAASPGVPAGSPQIQAPASPAASTKTITVGIAVGPDESMDPHDTIGAPIGNFHGNVFEGLFAPGVEGTAAIQPALAQSMEVSGDGLQLTFKLRNGVKFHDGSPMTSEDVLYSFQRVMDPNLKWSKSGFRNVDSASAPDPSTFVFKMKQPDAALNGVYPGLYGFAVVPKKYLESVGKPAFEKQPSGTGPYKITKFELNVEGTFERFADYYRGAGGFAGAVFKLIPDATSRVNALQTNDVQLINAIPPTLVDRIRSINSVKLFPYPTNLDLTYKFAIALAPGQDASDFSKVVQKDARPRQALNHAVDKAGIAKAAYNGDFAQPFCVTNPSEPFHIGKDYEYDPKKAKQLMQAAGVADGLAVDIWHPGEGRIPGSDNVGTAVQANLKAIGMNPNFQSLEFSVWAQRNRKTGKPPFNTGMLMVWSGTGQGDPFQGADFLWASDSIFSWWADPQFDMLMQKARSTIDPSTQLGSLKAALNYLFDQAPGLWTVVTKEAHAYSTATVKSMAGKPGSNTTLFIRDWTPA